MSARRLILGTAGHIDHGKTALVRALTGVDTDRLPEEKRRGITIDLGFAALTLDDIDFGIVDVPGHEALVRNMLAGATGIDIVMLVIAADEGIMPQTREHLAIMDLLEVDAAVVVLTKSDLVDADWLDLVTADVCDVLADTRFAAATVIPVSSTTGDGTDALRTALVDTAHRITERSSRDVFRLPIDRVFTVRGTGTVVTGTVWSGEVARDANLWVMPSGIAVRARGLQVHNRAKGIAAAGERVALAVAVDRDMIRRGDTLVGEDLWKPSMIFTAQVRVLPDAARPLRHRQRVRFHLGTAEILARIALLETPTIEPGATGWVQLRLEAPCIARAGDRFVLRSYSPVHTIAGGAIAEPVAPKRKRITETGNAQLAALAGVGTTEHIAAGKSSVAADAALLAVLQRAAVAGVAFNELPLLLPFQRPASEAVRDTMLQSGRAVHTAGRLYDAARADAARTAVLELIDAHHATDPLSPGVPRDRVRALAGACGASLLEHAVAGLLAEQVIRGEDGALARYAFQRTTDPAQTAVAAEILHVLDDAGIQAPAIPELPEHLRNRKDILTVLRFLEANGSAVALAQDRFAHRVAIDRLVAGLSTRFVRGQQLETSDLKDAIGVTRKYLIPILEYFDRNGITRRTGEQRTWIGTEPERARLLESQSLTPLT